MACCFGKIVVNFDVWGLKLGFYLRVKRKYTQLRVHQIFDTRFEWLLGAVV